jgi:hypothetical protein
MIAIWPCHGATPWYSTVIFRRFEKSLFLKDFCAVRNRWRRRRDFGSLAKSLSIKADDAA